MTIAVAVLVALASGACAIWILVQSWSDGLQWARERTKRNPPAPIIVGSLLFSVTSLAVIFIIVSLFVPLEVP
jgi:hypothetical protein